MLISSFSCFQHRLGVFHKCALLLSNVHLSIFLCCVAQGGSACYLTALFCLLHARMSLACPAEQLERTCATMPCCAVAAYSSYVWVRLEQMLSPAMSDVTAAMLRAVVVCVACRDHSCS
jgi:hypothetical protein